MTSKPNDYSTVSPYLLVEDAETSLRFLEHVFSATRLRVFEREDGAGVAHAEARIGDTVVMMGEVPNSSQAHVHVYVEDADDAFARAVAAGGTVVQDLRRSSDGDYRGGIADGNGIVWWISAHEGD